MNKRPAITPREAWIKPAVGAAQIKLLEKLSNAVGVSGDEGPIRKLVLEEIKPLVDEIKFDSVGNILAVKHGKGRNLPQVMLAAHLDEVGFMLTHDEGKGIFRFALIGGIDARQLPGKQVWVGKDLLPGVIGMNPVHLSSQNDKNSAPELNSLRIDIGPANGGKVKIGDRATFATEFLRLGNALRGKALDDRLGVASLITLLKNPPENIDLLAAFTVMEEGGLKGAAVAGYSLDPDMAIALDCTPALDMPVWDGEENTLYRSLPNLGPAIYVGDGATLGDPRLVNLLRASGDAYNIPYQLRQPGGGGTDAGAIHKQRSGIPSVSVSVPGRYLHTAISVVQLKDWQNSVALLHATLSHIDSNLLKDPR
jgi:putative aminopeptidase FrvX